LSFGTRCRAMLQRTPLKNLLHRKLLAERDLESEPNGTTIGSSLSG